MAKKAEAAEVAVEEKEVKAKATEEPKVPWELQKVMIRLFRDNDRYKDDVTVEVNGRVWRIQRGVDVLVPRYVAEVVENSLSQDDRTAAMIQKESDEFKAKEKHFAFD